MTIKVDIVTAERLVFSEDADIVMVPGVDGELGILAAPRPDHDNDQTGAKCWSEKARKNTRWPFPGDFWK